jgi:DNA-binding response OmpR family regulator
MNVGTTPGGGAPASRGPRATAKILVVEDEPDLLDLVVYNLRKEGFKAVRAENGETALELARDERPDLVLLDLMLPGVDGLEVCRRLRANEATANIPIVMMTARAEESDAVVGLALGADDYVKKPFGVKELLARVRAVLRRAAAAAEPGPKVVRVDDLEVDPSRHEVRVAGQEVVCTPTELRYDGCPSSSDTGRAERAVAGRWINALG